MSDSLPEIIYVRAEEFLRFPHIVEELKASGYSPIIAGTVTIFIRPTTGASYIGPILNGRLI